MMNQNLSMKVCIKKADLIAALEKNKKRHLDDYEKAVSVWFDDLRDKFTTLQASVEARDQKADYRVNLTPPVNNEKLYDKYIGMFTLATEDVIEITAEDYGCIVDDNWDWARQATISNAFYSSKFSGRR